MMKKVRVTAPPIHRFAIFDLIAVREAGSVTLWRVSHRQFMVQGTKILMIEGHSNFPLDGRPPPVFE
jgi:hypothetical protein